MEKKAQELLTDHLVYELDMLHAAFVFLYSAEHADARGDWFRKNAAIEAFWVHARNLIEFFERRQNADEKGVAAASDFAERDLHLDLQLDKLDERINEQVCHLTYERVVDAAEKINGYDMLRVKDAIDRAVAKFQESFVGDARRLWKRQNRTIVLVSDAPSTSRAMTTASSTTETIR